MEQLDLDLDAIAIHEEKYNGWTITASLKYAEIQTHYGAPRSSRETHWSYVIKDNFWEVWIASESEPEKTCVLGTISMIEQLTDALDFARRWIDQCNK